MKATYSYPWYLQSSPVFNALYTGFSNLAEEMSPLGMGDFFNYLALPAGEPIYALGKIWGLIGSPGFYDGLTYDVDTWDGGKVWSGELQTLDDLLYRNYLRMKMYIQGRPYSLTLIHEAIEILLEGTVHSVEVPEDTMSFEVDISAPQEVLSIIQQINSFDSTFLGKPVGISYQFNYIATDA